jgi:DNA-binding NarL/FixJ family response regulator
MKTNMLNLFIVDDDPMMVMGLQNYLTKRFGTDVIISTFLTGRSALEKVDKTTNIVILDYFLEGENGNDILRSIKKINSETEVIMLSSNEDMGVAVNAFRNGAADYVIKGKKSWTKITSVVYKIITYPVRMMVKEFGINKYIAMFLLTFLAIGIGVFVALKLMPVK